MNAAITIFTLTDPTRPTPVDGHAPGQKLQPPVGDCIDFATTFGVTATSTGGYGLKWYEGRLWQAHRLAWHLAGRELPPPPMLLRHRCHNRRCVNVDHLQPGTHRDNTADAVEAGSRTGKVLDENQVVQAYRWSLFRMTQANTAAVIGCTAEAIGRTLRDIWEIDSSQRSHRLTDEHRRMPKHRLGKYHAKRNKSLPLPGIDPAPSRRQAKKHQQQHVHQSRPTPPAPPNGDIFGLMSIHASQGSLF